MDLSKAYQIAGKIILLTSFLLTTIGVSGQGTAFPDEPAAFTEALVKYLGANKNEDCKAAATQLEQMFAAGEVTPDIMAEIAPLAENMRKKRMPAVPYFLDMTETIISLYATAQSDEVIFQWADIMKTLLLKTRATSNKPLKDWLDFSSNFFGNNTLYASKSKNWEVSANSFEIKMEEGVPSVFFPDLTLMGWVKGDSIHILKERGTYFPTQNKWIGQRGRIDWRRTTLDYENVYAEFGPHTLKLSSNEFEIDSVNFYYKPLLDKPLLGRLKDKMVTNNSPQKSSYPQFASYDKTASKIQLVENVNYVGAFAIKGSQFQGQTTDGLRSRLEFFNQKGELAVLARTYNFVLDEKENVRCAEAEVTIYIGEDSIFHPGIILKYDTKNTLLTLTREESGKVSSPFFSSFHQLEANPAQLAWNLNDTVMVFKPVVASAGLADFTSTNNFSRPLYDQTKGVVSYHPLVIMARYAQQTGNRQIDASLLARQFNSSLTLQGAQSIFFELMKRGFIFYDKTTEQVYIQDKTVNYVMAAAERTDYDVINMRSDAREMQNAMLNLNNKDIVVKGVKQINLSDSQFVVIFPKGRELAVKENRDLDFAGTVFGGSSDFFGENFHFNYDSFYVAMESIDSMVMYTPTGEYDAKGQMIFEPVKTSISGLSGTLYIDNPDNKSGLIDFPEFPYFESNQPAKALYNKEGIHDGAYDEERFFFEVNEFEMDSLDIIEEGKVVFAGKLVSAGIFPEIESDLAVMSDRSLGFETETPPEGYPLYDGKATFTDKIKLSNEGLEGNGNIEYLTTTLTSDRVLFFPDSAEGGVKEMTMKMQKTGTPFPEVSGSDLDMKWKVIADSMILKNTERPFAFFGERTELSGEMVLTPKGLRGNGRMDWPEGRMVSDDISFGYLSMEADSSRFFIKSDDADKSALDLPNAYSKIDFESKVGVFRSNVDTAYTDLPYNRYQTAMREFRWDMEGKRIEFKPPENTEYSSFLSLHKKQDSLSFNAKGGSYDMENHLLQLEGVPHISVADAHALPKDGQVVIEADAVMQTLEGATLQFDTLYGYHEMIDCSLNIYGRNSVRGNGVYKFVDRIGKEQSIFFHEIGVKERVMESLIEPKSKKDEPEQLIEYRVFANGDVPDTVEFFLDPKLLYKGPVSLYSDRENIELRGYAKLNIRDTANFSTGWFKINDEVETEDFRLPIDTAISDQKDTVYVGLMRMSDGEGMYPCILDRKRRKRDKVVMRVKGIAMFDPDEQVFVFGDLDKAEGLSTSGTLMTFDDNTGDIFIDAPIDMGLDFGMIPMEAAGTTTHSLEDSSWTFMVTMGMKMLMTDEIRDAIARALFDSNLEEEWLNYDDQSIMMSSLGHFFDEKQEEEILNSFATTGEYYPPEGYLLDWMFTDMKLVWDEYTETFHTTGEKSGIAAIGNVSINQEAEIWADFGPRNSADFFNIYIHTEYDDWFFFSYRKNVLKVLTSLEEVNQVILDTDPKKLTYKKPGTADQFAAMTLAAVADKNRFLSKIGFYESRDGEDE